MTALLGFSIGVSVGFVIGCTWVACLLDRREADAQAERERLIGLSQMTREVRGHAR